MPSDLPKATSGNQPSMEQLVYLCSTQHDPSACACNSDEDYDTGRSSSPSRMARRALLGCMAEDAP
eukprot:SAG31_NODE_18452_length_635_cov_3.072761_1_plen_65_part_01